MVWKKAHGRVSLRDSRERDGQTDTDVEGAETPIPLGGRSLGKISVK